MENLNYYRIVTEVGSHAKRETDSNILHILVKSREKKIKCCVTLPVLNNLTCRSFSGFSTFISRNDLNSGKKVI